MTMYLHRENNYTWYLNFLLHGLLFENTLSRLFFVKVLIYRSNYNGIREYFHSLIRRGNPLLSPPCLWPDPLASTSSNCTTSIRYHWRHRATAPLTFHPRNVYLRFHVRVRAIRSIATRVPARITCKTRLFIAKCMRPTGVSVYSSISINAFRLHRWRQPSLDLCVDMNWFRDVRIFTTIRKRARWITTFLNY